MQPNDVPAQFKSNQNLCSDFSARQYPLCFRSKCNFGANQEQFSHLLRIRSIAPNFGAAKGPVLMRARILPGVPTTTWGQLLFRTCSSLAMARPPKNTPTFTQFVFHTISLIYKKCSASFIQTPYYEQGSKRHGQIFLPKV